MLYEHFAACRRKHLGSSCQGGAVRKTGRTPTGQSSSAMPLRQAERFRSALVSDVNLFGNREGIVHFDTEISNGAFDLSVPKKQLHRSQIARTAVD